MIINYGLLSISITSSLGEEKDITFSKKIVLLRAIEARYKKKGYDVSTTIIPFVSTYIMMCWKPSIFNRVFTSVKPTIDKGTMVVTRG